MLIFRNAKDAVVTDRCGVVGIVFEYSEGVSVVAVETILGADPKITAAILKDRQPCILR